MNEEQKRAYLEMNRNLSKIVKNQRRELRQLNRAIRIKSMTLDLMSESLIKEKQENIHLQAVIKEARAIVAEMKKIG